MHTLSLPIHRLFCCIGIFSALLTCIVADSHSREVPEGEVLYNGIRLPEEWPPRREPDFEPMPAPYLASPPAVIPIDLGRQLFVDDFLIEESTLIRRHHVARPYENNPVIAPEHEWECLNNVPYAMVFSDGVWYDPADGLYKMWYLGGGVASTCYAISPDGLSWHKPSLDVVPGTNIVMKRGRDSGTLWLDRNEDNAEMRYKMFLYNYDPESSYHNKLTLHYSSDGIHWSDPAFTAGSVGDRTTVFFNPFRKVWVYGIRDGIENLGRVRRYHEGPDPISAGAWTSIGDPAFWTGADRLDPPYPGLGVDRPQLYNLDAVAYESLIIGLFAVWKGPENNEVTDRPKRNELYIGYSRDGFHWTRPLRRPFIGVSESIDDWNYGNVQSAGGCCLIKGDQLYFYYSGRTSRLERGTRDIGGTGLAFLRRDGFVSMDAGETGGFLMTRPVTFGGKHLFVNCDTRAGELAVEITDEAGSPIHPFTRANCIPVREDLTRREVRWKGADDIGPVAGKKVRFCFYLANGSLYSFWASKSKNGESEGFVGAGGPGLTGDRDNSGMRLYR